MLSVEQKVPLRVVLRDLEPDAAGDIIAGRRRPDWSPGYPTDGDRDIARWLVEHPLGRVDTLYQPKQIVDGSSGLVVGGIGCHRPPSESATVEIGYGVAAEARNRGITTEAVRILVEALGQAEIRLVTARTDVDNPASQVVLRHNGFVQAGLDGDGLIVWHRPLP